MERVGKGRGARPAMNGRLAELHTALTGTPISYEGVYLEVRLPDGTAVAELSTAFRASLGQNGPHMGRPDLAFGTRMADTEQTAPLFPEAARADHRSWRVKSLLEIGDPLVFD